MTVNRSIATFVEPTMRHVAWILGLVLVAGCAASPAVVAAPTRQAPPSPGTGASRVAVGPADARTTAPTRETFDALAPDVLDRQRAAFEQSNPGWTATKLPNAGPQFHATVLGARRTGGSSPRRPVTAQEAESKARAFLKKNASFFELTPDETAHLVATASPYPRSLSDAAHAQFLVSVRGQSTQRGFEAFPNMVKPEAFSVTIFGDGEVGVVVVSSGDVPELHIRTTPKIDAVTAAGRVVGEPIYEYAYVASIPNTYQSTYRRTQVGSIAQSAIRRTQLTIAVDYESHTRRTYFLAYQVDAEINGVPYTYLVDPDDGTVLKRPEPPGPIVP